MDNTGRICNTLKKELQPIIYGGNSDQAIENELKYVTKVDKAHILMLLKKKYLEKEQALKILNEIEKLEQTNFSNLRRKELPRGIYFLYEDYLRESVGNKNGGMLQFGRSRNDLKVTVLKLRLRKPYMECVAELFNFITILLKKSTEYKDIISPIYTHYQPAIPITYGHYLLGLAEEFLNITNDIVENQEIEKNCLGAGAVAGTTVSIDTNYTGKLLGFSNNINNSIVGVASRKVILDILSNIVQLEVLISRICEDFLLWTSSEFGLLDLPDSLVGGSSMMPNKRNAFLFENIRGRCSKSLGAYVSAITAMKGEPFTNSIAVGTEAVSYIWEPLKNITEIIYMLGIIVKEIEPNQEKMLSKCKSGYTLATEYANMLTLKYNIDFRTSHKVIGECVRESIKTGKSLEKLISDWIENNYESNSKKMDLDIKSVVNKANYGWGAGECAFNKNINAIQKKLTRVQNEYQEKILTWKSAEDLLKKELEETKGKGI